MCYRIAGRFHFFDEALRYRASSFSQKTGDIFHQKRLWSQLTNHSRELVDQLIALIKITANSLHGKALARWAAGNQIQLRRYSHLAKIEFVQFGDVSA
ncbi:hypothetical protein ATY29_19295 [Rhizobium hidalgonense]|nr:hypothetical protein ATY29_19295 [Rhizobium hidalgonense]